MNQEPNSAITVIRSIYEVNEATGARIVVSNVMKQVNGNKKT